MNQIEEMKHLFASRDLVAPIQYNNPGRDKATFFNFVQDYASHLGVDVSELKVGFVDGIRHSRDNICALAAKKENIEDRNIVIAGEASNIALSVLAYPIWGGTSHAYHREGNHAQIRTPTYTGLRGIIPFEKMHEYLHLYADMVTLDLHQRGITAVEGIAQLSTETITPMPFRAPTQPQLKKFERGLLQILIDEQQRRNSSK